MQPSLTSPILYGAGATLVWVGKPHKNVEH